ncbi:TPA: TIGR02391 family protein [Streptococcus suis]|uniref:TIGR02391 family protein n=1 Tax=Streptococcus ruminantium TaxID=1917441 RepID=UPI0012DC4E90|nr:TIGR02391 family protein [Streptococcus ruminantium]HEL1895297.1 TIGR02391 family protein [Streptococcus suis]HEL1953245.1 TIGR02391 family protein [Streptococcus suis]HEL2481474.1 TIGR02391 family protein [Streptococcus suis]
MINIDTQFIDTISKILSDYLSHPEITRMGEVLGYPQNDQNSGLNKHKRVHNIMSDILNRTQNTDNIRLVIEYICNPLRYIDEASVFEQLRTALNIPLSLKGLMVSDNGKIVSVTASKTLSEAKQRFETLDSRLKELKVHSHVLKFCTQELLQENYFHAVFEASKGIFHRIRLLTGSSMDSASLIDQCFKLKEPIVIINGNKLQTLDEQSEYKGLKNLLLTIAHLYRNSKAHKLKYYNPDNLNDALTALTLMSLAHNLLDNCSNTRRLD